MTELLVINIIMSMDHFQRDTLTSLRPFANCLLTKRVH
jgi:hypothetical protein